MDRHPSMASAHSATDSLKSHLIKDVDLSLQTTAQRPTWRESFNGIARSLILKAKDSIDTFRGAPEIDSNSDVLLGSHRQTRPFSSMRQSFRSLTHEKRDESTSSLHAPLSVRRVLTSSSKHSSKRTPLLLELMSKRSSTKLRGPEEIIDESSDRSDNSPARASVRTSWRLESPRSKRSSVHSMTPLKYSIGRNAAPTSPLAASSPIPIPSSSPPPTIDFEIETGKLSPNRMFWQGNSASSESADADVIAGTSLDSQTDLTVGRRRSAGRAKAEHDKQKAVHVPRRSSLDHWRLHKVNRRKAVNCSKANKVLLGEPPLPSPMPGTNLPLEDPFESFDNEMGLQADAGLVPSITDDPPPYTDGACDPRLSIASTAVARDLPAGYLRSPKSGHINAVTGDWISNDPISRSLITSVPSLPEKSLHQSSSAELLALKRASKDLVVRQTLLETSPDALPPAVLRAELEASRKALSRLEDRMASVELELRIATPDSKQRTAKRETGFTEDAENECLVMVDNGLCNEEVTKQEANAGSSSTDSFSTTKSPLETQDLFYPSDPDDNATTGAQARSCSYTTDSAWSVAQEHIRSMQQIASNGAETTDNTARRSSDQSKHDSLSPIQETSPDRSEVPSDNRRSTQDSTGAPSMGSPTAFSNAHAERAARYSAIYHDQNGQSYLNQAADSELAESSSKSSSFSSKLSDSSAKAETISVPSSDFSNPASRFALVTDDPFLAASGEASSSVARGSNHASVKLKMPSAMAHSIKEDSNKACNAQTARPEDKVQIKVSAKGKDAVQAYHGTVKGSSCSLESTVPTSSEDQETLISVTPTWLSLSRDMGSQDPVESRTAFAGATPLRRRNALRRSMDSTKHGSVDGTEASERTVSPSSC